jgi:hypothetical protein
VRRFLLVRQHLVLLLKLLLDTLIKLFCSLSHLSNVARSFIYRTQPNNQGSPVSTSKSRRKIFQAAAFAGTVMALAAPTSAFAQKADGPFAGLNGAWSGGGQVRLEGGKTERITCRAYYTPRDSGAGVGIALRCASTSFSINLRSTVSSNNGRVTGDWEETNFGASGNVVGRASPGNLSVAINGGGLSGSMSVSFGASKQQVSINTTGSAALRGVSVSLSR